MRNHQLGAAVVLALTLALALAGLAAAPARVAAQTCPTDAECAALFRMPCDTATNLCGECESSTYQAVLPHTLPCLKTAPSNFLRATIVAFIPLLVIIAGGIVCFFTRSATAGGLTTTLLHRKVFPSLGLHKHTFGLLDLTFGELFILQVYISCFWLRVAGFYEDFPSWSKGYRTNEVKTSARFYRSIGEVNFVNLGYILFPIARNSVWTALLGISYERAVRFHRWLGRWLVLTMAVHGIGMWIEFDASGDLAFAATMEVNKRTNWSNLAGMLSLVCFTLMFVFASPFFRRQHFEVFYFTHVVLAPIGIVFAYLHMPSLLGFMAPAIVVYLVDLAIRAHRKYVRGQRQVVALTALPGGVTRLTIRCAPSGTVESSTVAAPPASFRHVAGQYAFVTIGAISGAQAHPFSISSDCHADDADVDARVLTFHIKSMPAPLESGADASSGTWTQRLHAMASAKADVASLGVRLDGPYGRESTSVPALQYPVCVLVAGGIGVTPVMAVAEAFLRRRSNGGKDADRVTVSTSGTRMLCGRASSHELVTAKKLIVHWTTRDAEPWAWCPELLRRLHADPDVTLVLATSRVKDAASLASSLPAELADAGLTSGKSDNSSGAAVEYGRPNYETVAKRALSVRRGLVSATTGSDTDEGAAISVVVCGPAPLVSGVQRVFTSRELRSSFHFHKETFAL